MFTNASNTTAGLNCAIATHNSILLRYSVSSCFSILSAELFAIILAVKQIVLENSNYPYLILTDLLNSLYVLRQVTSHQHPFTKEIIHLPSHEYLSMSIFPVGNKLVDKVAKEEGASLLPFPNIHPFYSM